MSLLQQVNENQYRKLPTGADWNRPSGILKDKIVIIDANYATSNIVPTGFRFRPGIHELEVYLNGQYQRCIETIDGTEYGDYRENNDFSVIFEPNIITVGDIVRFRITSSSYNESLYAPNYSQPQAIGDDGNIIPGILPGNVATPNVKNHRTWIAPTTTPPYAITNLLGASDGMIRIIIFVNNLTSIENNTNIKLAGGLDFQGGPGDTLTLVYNEASSCWYELSRSLT